jgi:anti-sigma B factor antagonist
MGADGGFVQYSSADTLECTSSLDELCRVRAFVRHVCLERLSPPLDEESTDQLELAVNELISNIMIHAHHNRPEQHIQIVVDIRLEQVVFHCSYWGDPFDPAAVTPPAFDGSRENGFGMYIITQCVDTVHYTHDAQGRNCCSLAKMRYPSSSASSREKEIMDTTIEHDGALTIVIIPSEHLDASNAKKFQRDMVPIFQKDAKVIFDVSQVRFVDSSGLGALLSCLRQLHAVGGDLKLHGLAKPVRALFELVRMHRIFDIYNTREEAVQAFQS